MALTSLVTYLVALSVPAWLVVEQVHAWRGARAHRVMPQPADVPAHTQPLSGDLGSTAA
jgi:hypothetical protein